MKLRVALSFLACIDPFERMSTLHTCKLMNESLDYTPIQGIPHSIPSLPRLYPDFMYTKMYNYLAKEYVEKNLTVACIEASVKVPGFRIVTSVDWRLGRSHDGTSGDFRG